MDELTDWLNDWPHLYWPGGHEWAAWVLSHGTWFWSAPRCPPESHGNMQHVNLPTALRTRSTLRRCCMTDRLWCYCKCAVSVGNLACATLLKTQDSLTVKSKSACSHSQCLFCPTVAWQHLIVNWGLYRQLISSHGTQAISAAFANRKLSCREAKGKKKDVFVHACYMTLKS